MPNMLSSPPPRHRSPSSRQSIAPLKTPPLPAWDTPTSYLSRKSPKSTPRQRTAGPVPPLPTSPAMVSLDTLPPPSPRALSRSSSSSSSASSSRIGTPPLKQRPRSASKLLLALPLSINTQLTPPSRSNRRVALDFSSSEDIQIVISREDRLPSYPSSPKSPKSPTRSSSTPPRPARRAAKRRESTSPRLDSQDLLPPQPTYSRSKSPSTDSISTISEAASTPRAAAAQDRAETPHVISAVHIPASEPLVRKRDSAQRRLSALRGLVANLDFNQPWSLSSEQPEESQETDYFWACAEPLSSGVIPVPLIHDISPERPRLRRVASASSSGHYSFDQPASSPPVPEMPDRIDVTPIRQSSLARKPSSTPPRRPRQFRSSSDLLSRTPDPPRPTSRQRKEVFDVASSGYSKCLEPVSPSILNTPISTWRSSLSNDEIYQRVLQVHGSSEIKRQEIIWEMCETEQAFVKSMRTVLRLFAIPLKTPQGKWIEGIPERITELFDLLECVAHAHGVLCASQRDMRRRTEVLDVKTFIHAFREWVPKLHTHEWYLLRFEAVVQLVEDNVRDKDSVFGEFVRMQMKEEVLGSMSLGSMLLKPVQRLTKYPLFLRRLLDVAPYPHPCHADILSLLSTTETIILNLQATKAREEDYEQLQAIEARLHNLPEGFRLAIRGRKLLGQGSVVRVLPHKELSPSSSRRTTSLHSSRGSISSTVSSAYSSPWDFYSGLTPSTCRTSAFSVSSSASSYCPPSRSSSIVQTSPQRPTVSRSPSSASSMAESRPATPSSNSIRGLKRKEETLTMMVFNDVVIVASEPSDKPSLFAGKRKSDKTMRVLQEVEGGIGKVAEVKDWSGWQGHSSLFTVTLMPLATETPFGPITTAYTLPTSGSPKPVKNLSAGCAHLTSLQQFLTVLAQTTTLPEHHGIAEESGDEKEVLRSGDYLVL